MEVVLPGPPPRRGTPLPLNQLVEESRSRGSVPHHLLESKIYAKLKSNSLIEAEPSEVHFSGFELGMDYLKTLKLINISSEVMNIHIIPTQTSHFNTTYTKKCRLIPGLAYTLKVAFCPDEWRYFYDCVRVHCQGEENLLIPVHAYPVIDDLHIPPRIDLAAVPLGQSVQHVIPLRCSCPVDFEFQVYVLQPHAAFSVRPLAGEIPACGETRITVTFCPVQYETCHITVQLVVSQFNTRPYLCTISGSCAPQLALSQLEGKRHHEEIARPPPHPPSKVRRRSTREADKSKATLRDEAGVRPGQKPPVDVCTPAGVAKMLIKDANKLREAISGGGGGGGGGAAGTPSRQVKEALFTEGVQQNMKEEQANHLRWRVHLGMEATTERARRQILEKREIAQHDYTARSRTFRPEEDFAAGRATLGCTRPVREAGQAPEGTPSFQFYTDFHWELRRRPLRLFQQAARKVVIRCRGNRRLSRLKKPKSPSSSWKAEEEKRGVEISPERVFPSTFPFFTREENPLAGAMSTALPVDPVEVAVSPRVPFFKLQVPQRYRLMNYRDVSTWEAFTSYIPNAPARTLRTGAADSSVTGKAEASSPGTSEEHVEAKAFRRLSFPAPDALLRPIPANPLRIFNPAPGLQTYKPTPRYLESDPEFHLCPLPGYTVPGAKTRTPPSQKKRLRDRIDSQEMIPEVMAWKLFNSLSALSVQPALDRESHLTRTAIDYSTDILPLAAPLPLAALPDDPTPLMDSGTASSGVQLSPDMIRAQFLSAVAPVSNGNVTAGTTARHRRGRRLEETHHGSKFGQMARRATARLQRLDAANASSSSL